MRFIHASDIHLGIETAGFDRIEEHRAYFEFLYDAVVSGGASALVIAGDVFDSSNPSTASIKLFFDFLKRIEDIPRPFRAIVVAGNHDSPEKLSLPKALINRTRFVGVLPRAGGELDCDALIQPLDDAASVVCLAFPFLRAGDLGAEASEARLKALWRHAYDTARARYPHAKIIGTAHLYAVGGYLSDTERPALVGGAECVSIDAFPAELDYLALGHLHRPQKVSAPFVARYAGGAFAMSTAERDYRHSVVQVDLGDAGTTTALIENPRRAQFVRIPRDGYVPDSELLATIESLPVCNAAKGFETFLDIQVALAAPWPTIRAEVIQKLAGKNYRLMKLATSAAGEVIRAMEKAQAAGLDLNSFVPAEVFAQMHREKFGTDPSDDLKAGFRSLESSVAAARG